MSSALYWAPGPPHAVLTEPGAPLPDLQLHRKQGGWREHLEGLILLLPRVTGSAGPQLLASPPAAPIPPPAARPPSARARGMPGPSAQEAGFTPATCSCLERGTGACTQLHQGSCVGRGRQPALLGAGLALSLRPRELEAEVARFSQRRLEGHAGQPVGSWPSRACPLPQPWVTSPARLALGRGGPGA